MEDEIYFRRAAEKLLELLTKSQRKPVHQNARCLSMGEFGVMYCLNEKQKPISAGELGKVMGIGSGGVANLLNSLEKKGYACRVMNPSYRRGIMVSLSDTGRQLVREKQLEAVKTTTGLLSRLGREDTENLIRIYQRMLNIAEDYLRNQCKETK